MSRFKEAFTKYRDLLSRMVEDTAFSEDNSDVRVEQRRTDVYLIVYDTLAKGDGTEWCRHNQCRVCIEESKKRQDFRPDKASEAFCHLERYILFILLMPWKQEYRKIKKYSGFYQNEIENNLSKAESILRLAGFNEITRGVLVLTKLPAREELNYLAFECFVASVEFKIIADSFENAKLSRYNKQKVIYGDIKPIILEKGKYNTVLPDNVPDGVKVTENFNKSNIDKTSTDHYRTRLKEHMRQAQKLAGADPVSADFPFIDDESRQSVDFEEGTLEDHVKASLQIVENNESTPTAFVEPVQRNISASQEWSFVHEGLKQKFGNQYFEGPRKDILESTDKENNDNNIIKQKPDLHPVKFGDNPWSERIHKHARILPEGQVQNLSAYDSAYQSGSHAQFPPSIPSDKQFLSRSASAAYGKKSDTDVIMKKSNVNSKGNLLSQTAPLLRKSSAPLRPDLEDSGHRQFESNKIIHGNKQGVDTLKRELINNLSKEPGVGKGPVSSPVPIATVIASSGRTSGLGDSIKSRSFVGTDHSSARSRNENDGYVTPAQIPVKWPCVNCTYLNDCSSNVCKMCSKTRDGQLETDLPSVGSTSKVCDKCTLENDCSATQCQACGNVLRGSQTVV